MTPEINSHRRFLLFGILPVSLLMIAAPLSPHLAPQINEAMREMNHRQIATASPTTITVDPVLLDKNAPRISPSIESGLRQGRRMVALDVISRLENEARQQGGKTRLSPLDLKRLRNALRETGTTSVSEVP
ncbi:MAG: hypothetical protein V4671_13200 [Armatimonadota bacterium]